MRSDGYDPGLYPRHGIFYGSNAVVADRRRLPAVFLDFYYFPKPSQFGDSVHFVSGIVDSYHWYAGNMLCMGLAALRKKRTGEDKSWIKKHVPD